MLLSQSTYPRLEFWSQAKTKKRRESAKTQQKATTHHTPDGDNLIFVRLARSCQPTITAQKKRCELRNYTAGGKSCPTSGGGLALLARGTTAKAVYHHQEGDGSGARLISGNKIIIIINIQYVWCDYPGYLLPHVTPAINLKFGDAGCLSVLASALIATAPGGGCK